MNPLDEIAYQLKELNKNLDNVCSVLRDLTEINEHLGTLSTYLSSIDSSLEKIKIYDKDLFMFTIQKKDLRDKL